MKNKIKKVIKNKERKAQEEMIGFVLIIILVAIILLVFLFLTVKKTSSFQSSKEAENFIESLMKHTTNCIFSGNFQNVDDLVKACYNNKVCQGGRTACQELNETLVKLLEKSWNIENTPYTYYSLSCFFEQNNQNISIIAIEKGTCSGKRLGYEKLTYGDIISRFEVCVK